MKKFFKTIFSLAVLSLIFGSTAMAQIPENVTVDSWRNEWTMGPCVEAGQKVTITAGGTVQFGTKPNLAVKIWTTTTPANANYLPKQAEDVLRVYIPGAGEMSYRYGGITRTIYEAGCIQFYVPDTRYDDNRGSFDVRVRVSN